MQGKKGVSSVLPIYMDEVRNPTSEAPTYEKRAMIYPYTSTFDTPHLPEKHNTFQQVPI